jgi:hypothetical protein
MLYTADWMFRNRWADPGDLNRCILRSRRRTGWLEMELIEVSLTWNELQLAIAK